MLDHAPCSAPIASHCWHPQACLRLLCLLSSVFYPRCHRIDALPQIDKTRPSSRLDHPNSPADSQYAPPRAGCSPIRLVPLTAFAGQAHFGTPSPFRNRLYYIQSRHYHRVVQHRSLPLRPCAQRCTHHNHLVHSRNIVIHCLRRRAACRQQLLTR